MKNLAISMDLWGRQSIWVVFAPRSVDYSGYNLSWMNLVNSKVFIAGAIAISILAGPVSANTLSALITQDDGSPVQDAVVSIHLKGRSQAAAPPGTLATMIQLGQRFRPFILPVQVGTTVEFPNRDPFRHHVYSFSEAKTFELKLFDSSENETMTFDRAGVVPLGCNIHDNMLAYVYVVDTPHFAQTNDAGSVAFEELPPGDYTVSVWHPNQSSELDSVEATVSGDGDLQLQFEMDLRRSRGQRPPGEFDETEY